MRKTILILTLVFFVGTTAVASAGSRHHYRPGRTIHHYHNNGAVAVGILGAIGLGLLVGATVERANSYAPAPAPVYVPAYPPVATPAYVPVPVPDRSRAGRLVVITPRLYVRSGPGMHHGVVGEVRMNNVLEIVGSANGWWHVHLSGGQYGWVMADYTRLFSDPNVRG